MSISGASRIRKENTSSRSPRCGKNIQLECESPRCGKDIQLECELGGGDGKMESARECLKHARQLEVRNINLPDPRWDRSRLPRILRSAIPSLVPEYDFPHQVRTVEPTGSPRGSTRRAWVSNSLHVSRKIPLDIEAKVINKRDILISLL
eukprot:639753-Amorphochlora_amoeboformis.AAC.2